MADEVAKRKQPLPRSGESESTLQRPAWPMPLVGAIQFVGEAYVLLMQALGVIVRGGVDYHDVLDQMAAIGIDSIPIVLTITTSAGIVFAFYTTTLSLQVGVTAFIGGTLAYTFLNELGPTLCGTGVASRSGAAIAAEIGSMVVTEQIDALRTMAVSPIRYLVAPRLIATVIMMPLLTVLSDLAGILGGYALAVSQGVPGSSFWNSVQRFVSTEDLLRGIVKSLVFGVIISVVACHQGLQTSGGATGVGTSTTRSVVRCVILIFVSNFFLTELLSHPSVYK